MQMRLVRLMRIDGQVRLEMLVRLVMLEWLVWQV